MTIPSERYIDITSRVAGGSAVTAKELVLRVYTSSSLVPYDKVLSFYSANEVKDFFLNTEEVKIANYYFGFISKATAKPKRLEIARFVNADASSKIYGSQLKDLSVIKAVTAGKFTITIAGKDYAIDSLNLSTVDGGTALATQLQTAIKTKISNATVVYDPARNRVVFDSCTAKDGDISIKDGTQSPLDAIGFDSSAILCGGVAKQSLTACLELTTAISNNFGSFTFVNLTPALTEKDAKEIAKFVDGATVSYLYMQRVLASDYKKVQKAIEGYGSVCLTYGNGIDDYAHLLPSCVMASQNFNDSNAVESFMFQVDKRLSASVDNAKLADELDSLKINYIGKTQEAGKDLSFYQRGMISVGNAGIDSISVHVGEQWLRAELKAKFLNMLLNQKIVPCDEIGIGMGTTILNDVANQCKTNGIFSVGKELTSEQVAFIIATAGSESAVKAVQSVGFWFTVSVDASKNLLSYVLIYSKKDDVKHISGKHNLI